MTSLLEIIKNKHAHLARLANQNGALGEFSVLSAMSHWVPRPKGLALQVLLTSLRNSGISIKPSSFDAIALPHGYKLDFLDSVAVAQALPLIQFIEIKSASQPRVKPGFSGFFFALTESEISAADQLGARHRVALYNKVTEELLLTSVAEIIARAKSSTWQLSVQI